MVTSLEAFWGCIEWIGVITLEKLVLTEKSDGLDSMEHLSVVYDLLQNKPPNSVVERHHQIPDLNHAGGALQKYVFNVLGDVWEISGRDLKKDKNKAKNIIKWISK